MAGKTANGSTRLQDSLKFSIQNFGPISKGEIRLKPLTILMGPNNSGKSYAATLIYSLLSAQALSQHRHLRQALFSRLPMKQSYKMLNPAVEKLRAGGSATIPDSNAVRSHLVNNVLAPILKTAIERSFGASISELVRARYKVSRITMSGQDTYRIKITDRLQVSPKFNNAIRKIRISREPLDRAVKTEKNTRTIII